VHRVRSARALWSFEGGFATGYIERASPVREARGDGSASVKTPYGYSWLKNLPDEKARVRKAECVDLGASSHVLYSLSTMPGLRGEHAQGDFWLVSVVGGGAPDATDQAGAQFQVEFDGMASCRILRNGAEWWRSVGGPCGESSSERKAAQQQRV
jgi:hypothetical protein